MKPINQPSRNRALSFVPAIFMLVFLAAGFLMTLLTRSNYILPEDKSIVTGEWATAYEKQFNDDIPFRQFAIDTWGALEYLTFHEGKEGVLVGSDGWLYTNEEFLSYPDADTALENKVKLAVAAQSQLEQLGARFLVAVIPAKARVYPENLGAYSYPSYKEGVYSDFIDALEAQGIPVLGLLEPLALAKTDSHVFLHTDTHWTPFGAEIAANAIAKQVEAASLLPSLNTSSFSTEAAAPMTHEGDLLAYIPMGNLQYLGPQPDTLPVLTTSQEGGGPGLFGSQSIPITLIGTSYSANSKWHFEGALKQALGADVLNLADEGQGPVVPLEAYLSSDELRDNPPELVIWEVPERFLTVSYGD